MRGWKVTGRGAGVVMIALASMLGVQGVRALDAGQPFPKIGVKDLKGRTIDAGLLRGKVVIVDFWASWCEPCREELPVLDRLYRTYGERGLVVVGVSVDNRLDNVHGFLRKHPVSFPVVHDAHHVLSRRFEPPTMPSSYIIDRKGIVRHVHRGFRAGDAVRLEAQVKALLKDPAPGGATGTPAPGSAPTTSSPDGAT
jgi:peroxiredoxin